MAITFNNWNIAENYLTEWIYIKYSHLFPLHHIVLHFIMYYMADTERVIQKTPPAHYKRTGIHTVLVMCKNQYNKIRKYTRPLRSW